MAVGTPSRGNLRRYLPPSGTLALVVTIAIILMAIALVVITMVVMARRPPTTSLQPQSPGTLLHHGRPHALARVVGGLHASCAS